ncbi:glycosyltransferase family 4 protein [Tenacibaculum aiptasiae]|uniref:Glycosyltransferase family 4 protein n=1 Tax=Tenacibaculum aiptasiae TaxID=426481 RepID=A0A7J5A6U7_9FLAO|nr:glycosyltransferase [Tenacibaculum aiptasiae]KAB1153282.1 glycosyltransferase family 4 protein [Tenacibaculum aiptasiae]
MAKDFKKKVLLFENSPSDMLNSRFLYALFLKEKGFDVYLSCDHTEKLLEKSNENDFNFFEIKNVKSMNPITILKSIFHMSKIIRKEQIDLIHCYRFHPILIGTIAGVLTRTKVINHITGLGTYFSNKGIKNLIISKIIKFVYTVNNKIFKVVTIVQNPDDKIDLNLNCHIIKGSGVDQKKFKVNLNKENELNKNYNLTFFFASRLLKSKGVLNLCEAFKNYQDNTTKKVLLVIAGEPDYKNPDSISRKEYENIKRIENIQILGKVTNVNEYIDMATCSIFPSVYREGIPRFLIESLAMKKPIITTNTPGNKEAFNNNGVLMNGNKEEDILKAFLEFEKLDIIQMKENSEKLYKKELRNEVVFPKMLETYSSL